MSGAITVQVTLRVARGAASQQATIDAWLATRDETRQPSSGARALAILAEGAFSELVAPAQAAVTRLAAGCVCCVGWIPMRVHLQRAVRAGARSILLLIASDDHLPRVRDMLQQPALGFSIRLDEGDSANP